jgi:hypothetical protein
LPAFSFRLRQARQAIDGQSFGGQAAVLVESVLLGRLKKLLAPSRGDRVEPENAVDESIRLAG